MFTFAYKIHNSHYSGHYSKRLGFTDYTTPKLKIAINTKPADLLVEKKKNYVNEVFVSNEYSPDVRYVLTWYYVIEYQPHEVLPLLFKELDKRLLENKKGNAETQNAWNQRINAHIRNLWGKGSTSHLAKLACLHNVGGNQNYWIAKNDKLYCVDFNKQNIIYLLERPTIKKRIDVALLHKNYAQALTILIKECGFTTVEATKIVQTLQS